MTRRALAASAAVTALALALTGCVAKSDLAQSIPVAITDDGCAVAAADRARRRRDVQPRRTPAATSTSSRSSPRTKLRIVGEKENVTPGQAVEFVAQLAPGTYYTACKFQQVGAPIGLAEFTVTGEASAVVGRRAGARRPGRDRVPRLRALAGRRTAPRRRRRSPPPTPPATTRPPARCSPRPACPTSASSPPPRRSATSTRRSTSARSTPSPTASTGPASTASRRTSGRRQPATSTPTARMRSRTGRRRRPRSARPSPTASSRMSPSCTTS